MMKFDPSTRRFALEAEELNFADAEVNGYIERQEWKLMAETVGRMVRTRKPYVSWVPRLYQVNTLSEAPMAPTTSIADYVGTSQSGSASQTTKYVRPTFTYVQPTNKWVSGGGWYHMDDTRFAGWNAAQEVATQIAEEMAYDLDTWLSTILIAAIPVAQKITASALDFDTYRGVIADASSAGFPVTNVLLTTARAMDTADWGTANVTWLWAPLPANYGSQVATQGFISQFMGVSMEQMDSLSDAKVYFFSNPGTMGRYLDLVGDMRRLTDQDIDNRTVRFAMDQMYYQTTASAADVWEITIT